MLILKIGIILLFISLIQQGQKKYDLWLGFVIIAIVMAFQSNVGGDFVAYEESYSHQFESRTSEDEPFWEFLTSTCSSFISFRLFYFLLVVFQIYVLHAFIKQYTNKKYSWVTPLIFFFTFNMMLMQMKAVRQGFAVELCLLSFYLMDKAKLWKASIPAILSFFVHNSSIIVFPLLFLYFILLKKAEMPAKRNKRSIWFWPIVMAIITLIVYLIKTTIINNYILVFATLFADDEFRLIGYLGETENDFSISMVILMYNVLLVFLTTWYYQTANKLERVICIATIIASYIEILFFGMGSLFRMAMYFNILTLSIIPNILQKIENKYGRATALILALLFIGYAIKTSLPMLISNDPDLFGGYRFLF